MMRPDAQPSSVKIQKLEGQNDMVIALVALEMEIGKRIENTRIK